MKRDRRQTVTNQFPAFDDHEPMPKKHTGFGADISPTFQISNLCVETVSIAIIMDDLDIPFIPAFPHWLIWNIPKMSEIPENIPCGVAVPALRNAVQGIAYGKNRYRGPKQPFFVRTPHRYVFRFYALDCYLNVPGNSRKKDLLAAMEGHILQYGTITGLYQR